MMQQALLHGPLRSKTIEFSPFPKPYLSQRARLQWTNTSEEERCEDPKTMTQASPILYRICHAETKLQTTVKRVGLPQWHSETEPPNAGQNGSGQQLALICLGNCCHQIQSRRKVQW